MCVIVRHYRPDGAAVSARSLAGGGPCNGRVLSFSRDRASDDFKEQGGGISLDRRERASLVRHMSTKM